MRWLLESGAPKALAMRWVGVGGSKSLGKGRLEKE